MNTKASYTASPEEVRRHLHTIPELSACEKETSGYIADQLRNAGIKVIYQNFSFHSILAVISGKNEGPSILFRCELDALPILESNDIEYKSKYPGVSHKCGHDGHAANMISFAHKLRENPFERGTILLFFQSAEETGAGAKAALDTGIFEQFNIEYVFAYHNIPGYRLGDILAKEGLFTPCVESMEVALTGKTSHAAEPKNGINPAVTSAQIVMYLDSINQPEKNSQDYFISTPIHLFMGEKAYGTSASKSSIGYTFRAWNNAFFEKQKCHITEKIMALATDNLLQCTITWLEAFKANHNDTSAVNYIQSAAKECNYPFVSLENAFEFGEDFGVFTQKYKGAMFGIGSGEDHPLLHSEEYDFPDELIEVGSNMFYKIVRQILG
ncbi:MAG: amidohydrolase [Saprospiraceae bacterium]|jgi:amidohydrolase|nr:amidohydrolase [Saprospiraceae bacterium]